MKAAKSAKEGLTDEVDKIEDHDMLIKKNMHKIGGAQISEFKKCGKEIKKLKEMFKALEKAAESEDPKWHAAPKQQKALEEAKLGLSKFKKAKDNVLRSIKM